MNFTSRMTPVDVATAETLTFVTAHLGERARILEVGSGTGEVARALMNVGHDVVAVDSSSEAVDAARRIGVPAAVGNFPDVEFDRLFDAVIFTRSLHHIVPLGRAVDRTATLLVPRGVVIVEDFAFFDVEAVTRDWFFALLQVLEASGALLDAPGTFGRDLLTAGGAARCWTDHTHEINPAEAIHRELQQHFTLTFVGGAPYLYRYVAQMVPQDERGAAMAAAALALEQVTASAADSFLLGRRFVARAG